MEHDRAALLDLLRELPPADWRLPTAAAPWLVRDVVAHVLADDLSRLARGRDGHHGNGPRPGEPLARFLDRFNAQWVEAAQRISPTLLVDLLAAVSPQVLAFWRAQDLDALGEPVSWAGPDPAPVRLDCARDTTEYWVHHQQIREATGRPADTGPATVRAVLDTFLHAVPFTLRDQPGTALRIETELGTWSWERRGAGWARVASTSDGAVLRIDSATLWRLCVRMVEPDQARARSVVDGAAADAVLRIVSIIR
ncbi:maleylpyruvate isomerase family mycothiol-dependent enzyme [Pseudonocardia sp. S2-4]|uniref:Maleylpyruvate isomerase family mycothiol-dependent enzyme n=2 Tax=Pseudonocardia humida TaxID=2800819 RepID=A0ABT1A3L5_9PSEU|nr:maleylpyruvate isomerase family mycothiol-dependent enzyme [Pseudonocardia humida]